MGITHKFRIGSLPVKSTDGGWDKPSCTHLFRPCLGIVETLSTPIPTVSPCCAQYRACVERSLGWSRTSHICISGTPWGFRVRGNRYRVLPDSLSGYLHAGRVVPGNILRCVQSELHPNVSPHNTFPTIGSVVARCSPNAVERGEVPDEFEPSGPPQHDQRQVGSVLAKARLTPRMTEELRCFPLGRCCRMS